MMAVPPGGQEPTKFRRMGVIGSLNLNCRSRSTSVIPIVQLVGSKMYLWLCVVVHGDFWLEILQKVVDNSPLPTNMSITAPT